MRANSLFYIPLIIFSFIWGFILYKIADIQIFNNEYYKAIALGQISTSFADVGERGSIFSKDGQVLAVQTYFKNLYINKNLADEKTYNLLKSLGIDFDYDYIQKYPSSLVLVKKNLSKEQVSKINKLIENDEISGLSIRTEPSRFYPNKDMLSKVLGFIDKDNIGRYGIEKSMEKFLKGEKINNFDVDVSPFLTKKLAKGADVYLTIDYDLQYFAEKIIAEAQKHLEFKSAQVIVLDPKSGAIMALVDYPNFDPNNFSKYANEGNLEIFQNSTVQRLYEPGSVIKPLTMAFALNEGVVNPQDTYYDNGFIKVSNKIIRNFENRKWGKVNMTNILEHSINTGIVFVEQQIPHDVFLNYFDIIGFFEDSGVDLPDRIFSLNNSLKEGYEVNFATAAFGQGIEITPMHLIKAYTLFTNNGKIITPYIVEKVKKDGQILYQAKKKESDKILSEETVSEVNKMLVSVVENGFGKNAKIPGYWTAGKTGTADVPWKNLGIDKPGYSDETISSFIGYAPAFNPKFLMLVKVDQPKYRYNEGWSTTIIFRKIEEFLFNHLNIPPDYDINDK